MEQAVIYLRTSSATNVGKDKDSDKRQRIACRKYATANKLEVTKEFYDSAVKGKDALASRPGFADMLEYCERSGVKTILVEKADRFARDVVVQELGFRDLCSKGYTLIACDAPEHFTSNPSPAAKMVRQMLGSVAEYQKDDLVEKLRGARERKRQVNKKSGLKTLTGAGKCEGKKSHRELNPELVKAAKKLLKWSERSGKKKPSLREAAQGLFDMGYQTTSGKPFSAAQIQRIVKR
jgi:DNA invertase Pin-like site-specific DNA recombinase